MITKNLTIKITREPVDESKIEIVDIIRAEYAGGYRIHLWFSNGKNHIVDFEPFLMSAGNPMSTRYRDMENFRRFCLDHGNLQWNDYEMCFSMEDLYNNDIGIEISEENRRKLEDMVRHFD